MSEYQYYEFLAVDRPLDAHAQTELRAISSRARISATGFVNSYDWGDLNADPLDLLARDFDVFLYVANWGTHRFAMRLPKRLFDMRTPARFELPPDAARIQEAGENVILDIVRPEIETDWEDWDDGSRWMARLAPLRTNLLDGDMRLFGVLWLLGVEDETVADEAVAPQPGIAPLDDALAMLAEFLAIDPDLLVAAQVIRPAMEATEPGATVESFLQALPQDEKVALLRRAYDRDPHVAAELRRRVREERVANGAMETPRWTAGELRMLTRRTREERVRLAGEKEASERRRQAEIEARAKELRLTALAAREGAAWSELDQLIAQRNPLAYEKATALLVDLGEIAAQGDRQPAFARRVADLGSRHAKKGRLLERLRAAGLM